MSGPHLAVKLANDGRIVQILELGHAVGATSIRGTLSPGRGIFALLVEVVLKFLVPRLAVDVRHSRRCLHTLTRVVVVDVLKRILVEVDGRWSEALRCRL